MEKILDIIYIKRWQILSRIIYNSFFIKFGNSNNNKISHTINPKTLSSIKSQALSVTVVHKRSATYADALATAFNAIGYPESLDYANKHNIALMLVVELDNEFKLMFSNEWYNLGLWVHF